MQGKVDVMLPTLNSGEHLDEVLTSIESCVPVNRIVAADGHSTDETLEILGRHHAEVISDGGSLGAARQALIDNASTERFLMLDSDVVLRPGPWFTEALKGGETVVFQMPLAVGPLQRFVSFWWRLKPPVQGLFFGTMATFFSKSSLQGIRIPKELSGTEDVYILLYLMARKQKIKVLQVQGIHYHSPSDSKGAWVGSSLRILQSKIGFRAVLPVVLRNVIIYPFAVALASFLTHDKAVFSYGFSLWRRYAKGYFG